MNWDPVALRGKPDECAPDGSEIWRLVRGERTSLCQCVLPGFATSRPIRHSSVEESWLVLAGEGQIWRRGFNADEPLALEPGVSVTIPPDTAFQFKNAGAAPLKIAIATSPPWPGDGEASTAPGYWS